MAEAESLTGRPKGRCESSGVNPVVAVLSGLIDALKGAGLAGWMPSQLANLPLSEQGLAWLVPSVMMLVAAVVVDRMLGKRSEAVA